ncbi:solute carrier family 25 member 46-like [Coccinella septempunctata]|uniref:solute carrier family 25 member 46-like n=1 Tax=Coccinella septempunctata TaxID=41139 RepID=UPI001D0695BF|nr:solute carrier family 25 member 46-like [Coccinella septempunctata]
MAGKNLNFSRNNPRSYEEGELYNTSRGYNYGYDVEDEFLRTQEEYLNTRLRTPHSLYSQRTSPHYMSPNAEEVSFKRYVASGVSFVSLVAENILCHPFLVLRRQCQVHPSSLKYHLLPFTLIPSVYHLHQRQGLTILWKGLGSVLLVRGISLGVEDLIARVTPWPDTITMHSGLKQFFQHLMLKCVSLAIVTPFYSASFVETVQSEIASEKPGILDVFKEGFIRLLSWNDGPKGRLIPIWALVLPTVTLGLAKYLFSLMIKSASSKILLAKVKYEHETTGALPRISSETQDINLSASIISLIASDIVFYPCETIVHRLHLQGTRTIIDNLDNGSSVLAVLTNYTGAADCYEQCLASEGVFGLYKGFGALLVQYALHIGLVKFTRFVFTEIGSMMSKPKSSPPPTMQDISPPALANLSTVSKSYLLP